MTLDLPTPGAYAMKNPDVEIIQADFAVTLARAAEMGGADLVLMSPPYEDARTYGADVCWTMADYQRLGDSVFAALKPGGHCLMVLDGPVRDWRPGMGTERSFTPWRVMIDWAMRVGFRVPERLAYSRHGNPGAYAGRFRNDWEPLLWFQHPAAAGFFDKSVLAEKAKHPKSVGSVLTGRRANGSMYRQRVISEESANTKHRGTIWHYLVGHAQDDDGGTDHPATFCYRFAEDAVCCFCPPGGLVVDPFSGSGTSAVAAAKHGRRFFGGDLLARPSDGKPWAQVALERVAKATAQQVLPLALSSDRNPR